MYISYKMLYVHFLNLGSILLQNITNNLFIDLCSSNHLIPRNEAYIFLVVENILCGISAVVVSQFSFFVNEVSTIDGKD
jgi:hypothetical protein